MVHQHQFTVQTSGHGHMHDITGEVAEGEERNLLMTGNDFGKELMETGKETLDFYTVWLGSQYIRNSVAEVDTLTGLRDAAGGDDFMTHGDRYCILRGG